MIKIFRFDNDRNEFSANTYVVGIKNGPCVVIDLGSTQERVIKYIKENHTSCSGILLTHGHFDHIRGINNFIKEFNCTIFIDEKDVEFLQNPRLNCSFDEEIVVKSQNLYLLDDEDEINFGNSLFFKVIETPFHTQGSVCFLYETENALFTGDTLFKGSIGRTDLPGSKSSQIGKSLDIIKKLDPNLKIYPGHGDESTLEHEIKTNYFMNGGV